MAIAEDDFQGSGFARTSIPAFLVVLVATLLSLAPFAFLVVTSFEPMPGEGVGSLWTHLFAQVPVVTYMLNSAIVSIGSTILVLIASCMAGFGFSKLPFPGSRVMFVLLVGSISVPLATIVITNYFNFALVGGIATYWGPIVMYAALGTPFATVLMTNFFRSLPDELVESAIVDGANYWQVFTMIMDRLATPALMTVGVLSFLGSWNDLLIGLLFLPDPGMRTISVGVAALQGVRSTNIELILTGSLLSALPPIITFLLFQKYLVAGITAGISK